MANEYKKIPLNEVIDAHPEKELIQRILFRTYPIANLLSEGCYIAGGFGRVLMNGGFVGEYLGTANQDKFSFAPTGDIDIFFSDVSKTEKYRNIFGCNVRSLGKNALEVTVSRRIRVQLVDAPDLVSPIEEQMDRFDFTNACVAITHDHVIMHERFEQIERAQQLDVKRCHSPFLGSRIMKYFKHRGLQSITPESEPLITEWIMRALSMNFDLVEQLKIVPVPGSLNHAIQGILKESKLTRADDLLLVLGKFKTSVKESYGLRREVDFALHCLKERGCDVTVPAF